VNELERRLEELGRLLELPPEPELAREVARRIVVPRRPDRRRLALAIALAALAAAIGAAFAVPQSRAAILDFFGIGGVRIEVVEELPPTRLRAPLGFGPPVSLAEARRRVDFDVRVPAGLGEPDAVYVAEPEGAIVFRYGDEERPRALLLQFRGEAIPYVTKAVRATTRIERLDVAGADAVWISDPHIVVFADRTGDVRQDVVRLAGPVLLWERDGITYRLETSAARDRAVEIAESLR
jgi:hypothetical protein